MEKSLDSLITTRNRDAHSVIAGFAYQIDLTLLKWLELNDGEFLYLESGEDFDTVGQHLFTEFGDQPERILAQVKKRTNPVTLRSREAVSALASFREHIVNNPNQSLFFRYVTNARIGKDRLHPQQEQIALIPLWEKIRKRSLSASEITDSLFTIQSALSSVSQPRSISTKTWQPFIDFVRSASPQELLTFIDKVEWATEQAQPQDIADYVRHRIQTCLDVGHNESIRLYETLFIFLTRKLTLNEIRVVDAQTIKEVVASNIGIFPEAELRELSRRFRIVHESLSSYDSRIQTLEKRLRHNAPAASDLSLVDRSKQLARLIAAGQVVKYEWVLRGALPGIDRIPTRDLITLSTEEQFQLSGEFKRHRIDELSLLHQASMVLGEPGAGKSASLQKCVQEKANDFLVSPDKKELPLYINLKWYLNNLPGLIESITRSLTENFASEIWNLMSSGGIVLYLDSFDEAQNPSLLTREIQELILNYPKCRFVIASRPVEILAAFELPTFEIVPLNRAQIQDILTLYLSSSFNALQIEEILEQLDHFGLFPELGNPMMMWFFTLALRDVRSDEEMPLFAKGSIFRTVVEQYFLSDWEPKSLRRLDEQKNRFQHIKTKLLSKLAYRMVHENDTVVIRSDAVTDGFQSALVGFANPGELSLEVLDQVLRHNILEQAGEKITFWHKSLRNYFAAREVEKSGTLESIDTLLSSEKWFESTVMLASLDPAFQQCIAKILNIRPSLAVECIALSPMILDGAIVAIAVKNVIEAFLAEEDTRQKLEFVHHFAKLYRRNPTLVIEAVFLYVHEGKLVAERAKHAELTADPGWIYDDVQKLKQEFEANDLGDSIASIEAVVKSLASYLRNLAFDVFYEGTEPLGLRIITNNDKKYCYLALSVLHDLWTPIPERFRDWIAIPLDNLYQALHTTVIETAGRQLEIIIQTLEMTEVSQKVRQSRSVDKDRTVFLAIEARQHDPVVPLSSIVLDKTAISVFTSRDDLAVLPEDSTVLDLAHKVHSETFRHCTGALVNNRRVSRGHRLKNLDSVEVLWDKNVEPDNKWLSDVTSASARKSLEKMLRQRDIEDSIREGKQKVTEFVSTVADSSGRRRSFVRSELLRLFGVPMDELYRGVSTGKYDLSKIQIFEGSNPPE